MKRIIVFFLVCLFLTASALADGDANIGSGGGGMGSGSGSSYWNPGWDGVRVTVVDTYGNQVCPPIDLTNKNISGQVFHFGKHSKLYYQNNQSLTLKTSDYSYINPTVSLPTIVLWTGGNNIEAIKSYFTDQTVLEEISDYVGLSYNSLISGDYKLLLEPIAYFKYRDISYAMTSTEAALMDIQTSHQLYHDMRTLTHQNLPLAMFLEKSDWDIGIAAWTGATSGFQTNLNIIKYLGVGVVSFKENSVTPDPTTEYTYHTDTDVITAISFTNTWGEINPDNPAWVTFTINGTTYSKEFICPAGGHQIVWVRWHTPDTPQDVTVNATCSQIGLSVNVLCHVVELKETQPPDPGYYDSPTSLTASVPDYGSNTENSWGEWFASWHANWVWVESYDDATETWSGDWVDEGWWDWNYQTYTATLNVDYDLTPDTKVQTAFQSGKDYEMKSGYGVNAICKAAISRSSGASSYDVTDVQNVVAVFPEFNYTTYNRLFQYTGTIHGYDYWEFKPNKYSYYNNRVHFTPLWYPDNTKYTVPLQVIDVWTPGGQLYTTVSDFITINGDMYDDVYIRILK